MIPPRLISALPDEAPGSWMVRLANSNYQDVKGFCKIYGLSAALKTDLDISPKIDADFFSSSKTTLPVGLQVKIPDFKWQSGRSDWLIDPNKNGHAQWNSFTRLCPGCLTKYGYFRNSWKLQLFIGCIICNTVLIENCPECLKTPSTLRADYLAHLAKNYNPLHYCWFCGYDYRIIKSTTMSSEHLESMKKIDKAYSENPVNLRYLKFLQYGTIEEFMIQRSLKSWK